MNLIFLLIYLNFSAVLCKKFGWFWHVSEIDVDDPKLCQTRNETHCLQYKPLLSTLITKYQQVADFMIWTGFGGRNLVETTKYVQSEVHDLQVIPVLGAYQWTSPYKMVSFYQDVLDIINNYTWANMSARDTFLNAGYYEVKFNTQFMPVVLVLNTAIFCEFDAASESNDPGSQWTWLTTQLFKARADNKKVFLLLSVYPGVFETIDDRMFAPKHNKRYLQIVCSFSDVIIGQFAGYGNKDRFRVFYDKNDKACGWLLVAPSIPIYARLYLYNLETYQPIDYVQFYYKNEWHVEYKFTHYYLLPNISVFSFNLLIERLYEDDQLYTKVIKAGLKHKVDKNYCYSFECLKQCICSSITTHYDDFIECNTQDYMAFMDVKSINSSTIADLQIYITFITVILSINYIIN